ncbi:MAG TPA: hypothetical protein VN653_07060 [Anaerolineales bacterium]|nr:hypothetical protein [Anaerolineales bacterium]
MSKASLVSLGGIAAVLAGILRGIASFIPATTSDVVLQLLYMLTDLFILLGIFALYGIRYKEAGKLGFLGFLFALVGILVIRSSKAITGVNLYPTGSLIFSLGLIVLGIRLWLANVLPSWVVGLWSLSVFVGIIAYFVPSLDWLFVVAGLLFAIGFAAAGSKLRSFAATAKDV